MPIIWHHNNELTSNLLRYTDTTSDSKCELQEENKKGNHDKKGVGKGEDKNEEGDDGEEDNEEDDNEGGSERQWW